MRRTNRTILLLTNLQDSQTLLQSKAVYYEMTNQTMYKLNNRCQNDKLGKNDCLIENHTSTYANTHAISIETRRLQAVVLCICKLYYGITPYHKEW